MLAIDSRATDDVGRYACAERWIVRLRQVSNAEATTIGRGLTLPQFHSWHRHVWRPKFKHVCLELGQAKSELRKLKEYAQPRTIDEPDPLQALKLSGRADTKWDRDFNFNAIEPRGKGITPVDPVQDFTTWTEQDAGGYLSETSTRVTFTNIPRNATAYLYKDFGAGHFNGDFEFLFTSAITANPNNGILAQLILANALSNLLTHVSTPPCIFVRWRGTPNNNYALAEEYAGPTEAADVTGALSATHTYYMTLERDESVGTYGTIYLYIYSDSGRTTLVDTLAVALHVAKQDYRYLQTATSYNDGNGSTSSGYVENLDLQEAAAALPARSLLLCQAVQRAANW